nr:ankyrin-1-like isoform X3 [Ziziphus jujuba var. spinosa]
MVEVLIGGLMDIENQQAADLLRTRNLKEKDTALHVAVKNGHFDVAKLLMEKDAGLLDLVNDANESPVFLAVERGFLNIAQHILQHFPSSPCCGSNDMNALHAAVIRAHKARMFEYRAPDLSLEKFRRLLSSYLLHAGDQCINIGYRKGYQPTQMDIMHLLLEKGGHGLAGKKDVLGWTPLHCAAHLGHLEATQLLLQNSSTRIAYLQDNEGMSALHIAAKQGRVNVMEQIINHKPDACDLVDNRGWNPLHVAIANTKLNAVRFILKKPRLESLINAVDNEGNTPLHLAAGRNKYSIITILVNDIRVHKKTQNHNFQKPIDLIRTNPNIGELFKSVIAMKLEKQDGRPSLHSIVHKGEYEKHIKKDIIINRVGSNRYKDHDHTSKEVGYDQDKDMKAHRLKNISNIHLLVASLIATVTFTAGFTVPGGYEQNESPRKGLALLSNKTSFQLFVIADSIAFYFSSASVFLQFCGALEHNYHLLLRFTRVAATLTYISSLGMVVAFTSAMHAVMPSSSMLAYYTFVSGICCVFAYIFGFL